MFQVRLYIYGRRQEGLTALDTIRRLGLTADATALDYDSCQERRRKIEVPESFARRHAKLFQNKYVINRELAFSDLDAGDCIGEIVPGPDGDTVFVGLADISPERGMDLAERAWQREEAEHGPVSCLAK